jgi:hypothetical protein
MLRGIEVRWEDEWMRQWCQAENGGRDRVWEAWYVCGLKAFVFVGHGKMNTDMCGSHCRIATLRQS